MNWRTLISLAALFAVCTAKGESIHRVADGLTAFVNNPEGKAFRVSLDVRDINIYENGPRELLVKIYDPNGKTHVREVVPDDGIIKAAYQHPAGAWDHEAWYYAYSRMTGEEPMIRWSAYSDINRLKAVPARKFTYEVPGGVKGVYRILLAGATDHYVTLNLSPDLEYGLSGHPTFIHGSGDILKKCYIYVPKGTIGLHVVAGEWDKPRSRTYTLKASDGTIVYQGDTLKGFTKEKIEFEQPGKYDDQILELDVAEGEGDYLLMIKHRFAKDPEVSQRGEPAVSAVFAPSKKVAKAIQGGSIYHDDRVFWHPYQVRLHNWLKSIKADDFVIRNTDGKEISHKELPQREGFLNVNGNHWRPPACDTILHSWSVHKNPAALNVAIKDLIAGLRSIGPNDHVAVAVGGPFANMGYEFSNYAFHYWRPGWKIIHQTNAPEELKDLLREAYLVGGDRLAFCRSWARVNGNSFALIPTALRYCSAATEDPLQQELAKTYLDRFLNGGWGDRVGIGPSGSVQEGFAYAWHYASYPMRTWKSVIADFGDEDFTNAYNRMRTWFSYVSSDRRVRAGAWSSRTQYYPQWTPEEEGQYAWKGLPGPDFTVSVNDANEWFAARRKNYYALTYHGRLSPKWNSNANAGQCGFGGGMLSQLQVPERGPVLASTLNGGYGEGMHLSLWRDFHIHSLVGTAADGRPLVSGDSEHFDAKMESNRVTSSGDLRDSSLRVKRAFEFLSNSIRCEVQMDQSDNMALLNLWTKSKLHGHVNEVYEMIPFVEKKRATKKDPAVLPDFKLDGELRTLDNNPVEAQSIEIDLGGYGVTINLDQPRKIHLGSNHTLLIEVNAEKITAEEIALQYELIPFNNPE